MKSTKKIIIFSLLLSTLSQLTPTTNKTFFMPRPIQQDAVIQNAMSLEFRNSMVLEYAKDTDINCGFLLTANLFYEQSTDKSGLAKYFSIDNKHELVVAGNLSNIANKDIAAEWLGISPWNTSTLTQNFSSKINLSPDQKEFGLNFQAHKILNFISKKLLFSITLPFIQKETNLKIHEHDIQNAPTKGPVDVPRFNMEDATNFFNYDLSRYAKIKDGVQKLAGLADINLKLNYFFKNEKSWTLAFYPQLTIPTGYKPTAKYLFEPIIGNARHWGLGAGVNFEMELFDNDNHLLSFLSSIDYNYLFQSTEKRTLDLKNKPWSRYLRLANKVDSPTDPQINTVAANLFTQDIDVQPKSDLNLFLALHYNNNDFLNLEFGYNLWWKAKEDIKLKNAWTQDVGITQLNEKNLPTGSTISQATIATNPTGTTLVDGTFITINQSDFDLNSAAHDSAISNKIYLSGGVEGTWKQNIYQTNLGCSYEFAGNKALSAWSLWLQTNLYV